MKVSFDLGRNGFHRPSGLGRLIVVLFLKFDNFSSGACLGCLNRFVVLTALYQ